jgi:acyl-CoA thioester hydrolase
LRFGDPWLRRRESSAQTSGHATKDKRSQAFLAAGSSLAFVAGQHNVDVVTGRVFRHEHRVPYAQCTLGNHVYYSRYLDILEAARGEFFRSLGKPFLYWQEHDTIFPVVECRLRYKGAARYDDVVVVELWVTAAEKVRLNFAYRILNGAGQVLVEADTLHVCTSLQDKPKRLPEELGTALQPFLTLAAPSNAPT